MFKRKPGNHDVESSLKMIKDSESGVTVVRVIESVKRVPETIESHKSDNNFFTVFDFSSVNKGFLDLRPSDSTPTVVPYYIHSR